MPSHALSLSLVTGGQFLGAMQVWLTLHNLVADPSCRGKLAALRSESGREALLGLRTRLTEPLLDQMPPLGALQRALNELALGALPTASGRDPPNRLIIEQVTCSAPPACPFFGSDGVQTCLSRTDLPRSGPARAEELQNP